MMRKVRHVPRTSSRAALGRCKLGCLLTATHRGLTPHARGLLPLLACRRRTCPGRHSRPRGRPNARLRHAQRLREPPRHALSPPLQSRRNLGVQVRQDVSPSQAPRPEMPTRYPPQLPPQRWPLRPSGNTRRPSAAATSGAPLSLASCELSRAAAPPRQEKHSILPRASSSLPRAQPDRRSTPVCQHLEHSSPQPLAGALVASVERGHVCCSPRHASKVGTAGRDTSRC
mmetsp:Transcript_111201/g.313828  ORF Transcript_111201/g.313828 Transcript_111201/m.313828 type:complete len:229 (+) Transcript_111201:679-1365(+)